MADADAAYAPSYYDETNGLPAPEGVYGKEIHSTKSIAVQINEAQLFLDLIKTQDPIQYSQLTKTSAPMPVLVKVPGEGRDKMLLGVAPYEADPFITPKPTINGKFLAALKDDIDDPKEAPTVITFDDTEVAFAAIMAPTVDEAPSCFAVQCPVSNSSSVILPPIFKSHRTNFNIISVY